MIFPIGLTTLHALRRQAETLPPSPFANAVGNATPAIIPTPPEGWWPGNPFHFELHPLRVLDAILKPVRETVRDTVDTAAATIKTATGFNCGGSPFPTPSVNGHGDAQSDNGEYDVTGETAGMDTKETTGGEDGEVDTWPACVPTEDAPETKCDGKDNDCDGNIDWIDANGDGKPELEEVVRQACDLNVGVCKKGFQLCLAPDGESDEYRWSDCLPEWWHGEHPFESCNGMDDDCNGQTDENFGLGIQCDVVAPGECYNSGVTVCSEDGTTIKCSVGPKLPEEDTELSCDGKDNDCDGETDESHTLYAPCSEGVGICKTNGYTICDPANPKGQPICNAKASPKEPEVCDGADNDCDGVTDNIPTNPCVVGLGLCATPGTTSCFPAEDGVLIDFSLKTYCNPGTPVPAPQKELCNGADDDCNGFTDENLPFEELKKLGTKATVGLGACEVTCTYVCSADGEGINCIPDAAVPEPTEEICNGIDDDCDGDIDEDFITIDGLKVGDACANGVGACAQPGIVVCSGDGAAAACDAVPLAGSTEICNTIDDDCNGTPDDVTGLNELCDNQKLGACMTFGSATCEILSDDLLWDKATKLYCKPGGPVAQPTEELCDNVDNDCDGWTDEELGTVPCGVGECVNTVPACVDGAEPVCEPKPAGVEDCNGKDDDCNGSVAEEADLKQPCGTDEGECKSGFNACNNPGTPDAGWSGKCTGSIGKKNEICDGLDNDCDGTADEISDGLDDFDGDQVCDEIDPDDDNDGVSDATDNCHFVMNADQLDSESDGLGNVCDDDDDNDTVLDSADNCVFVANADQANSDGDALGNACDPSCTPVKDTILIQDGETASVAFEVSGGQVFTCDSFEQSLADPAVTTLVTLSPQSPAETVVVSGCTVSGGAQFGPAATCPDVTVQVNHGPAIGSTYPEHLEKGILPDGDQLYTNANNIVLAWNVVDADGDIPACKFLLKQGDALVESGLGMTSDGTIYGVTLPADQLHARRAYDLDLQCDDGKGGIAEKAIRFWTSEKGLIDWRPFDEGAGSVAGDFAGVYPPSDGLLKNFGFNGTNSDWVTKAVRGSGLRFDGTNDAVVAEGNLASNVGTGDFTVSGWIRPQFTATLGGIILSHRAANNGFTVGIGSSAALAFYGTSCATSSAADTNLSGEAWYFFAVTRTEGSLAFYLNGSYKGSGICTDNISNATPLNLGSPSPGIAGDSYFRGVLDEVKLYNRALASPEIKAQYEEDNPF